jgi:beta-galactosidase
VVPEAWPEVNYGYVNWLGSAAADPTNFDRTLLTVKRRRGPNLEENWSFGKAGVPTSADTCSSFYNTLLALAGGATGYNVYTGVSTNAPDLHLDGLNETPFPDSAPITAEGTLLPKATTIRWLNQFLHTHGAELLTSSADNAIAYGLYLPYARLSAWNAADAPLCGRGLREFQRLMNKLCLDYDVVNIDSDELDPKRHRYIVLHGGRFMATAVQEKLAAYTQSGGKLCMVGAIPAEDENFSACGVLAAAPIRRVVSVDNLAPMLDVPRQINVLAGRGDLWLRTHPTADVQFVIALIPAGEMTHVEGEIALNGSKRRLRVQAAPGGGAILRIAGGRITAAVIKGVNEGTGQAVAPMCTLDGQGITFDTPQDAVMVDGS